MGARLRVQDLTRPPVPCEGCGEDADQTWGKVRYCSTECRSKAAHRRRYYALPKEERVAKKYTHVPKSSVPCEACSAPVVKRGDENRRFCAMCRRGKGHIARALRYGVPIEPVNRARVFARDGWVCQICQRPVNKGLSWPHTESASLDHIVPLSRGGAHSEANARLAHLGCNVGKGATIEAGDLTP